MILVVDDNPSILRAVSLLLRNEGFAVATAPDGHIALRRIADLRPALVLLDWMMPGISGAQVLREIRRNPATRQLPVLLFTSMLGSEEERAAVELGADGLISKANGCQRIAERVRSMLASLDESSAEDDDPLAVCS